MCSPKSDTWSCQYLYNISPFFNTNRYFTVLNKVTVKRKDKRDVSSLMVKIWEWKLFSFLVWNWKWVLVRELVWLQTECCVTLAVMWCGVGPDHHRSFVPAGSGEPQLHVDAAAVFRVRTNDGVLSGRVALKQTGNTQNAWDTTTRTTITSEPSLPAPPVVLLLHKWSTFTAQRLNLMCFKPCWLLGLFVTLSCFTTETSQMVRVSSVCRSCFCFFFFKFCFLFYLFFFYKSVHHFSPCEGLTSVSACFCLFALLLAFYTWTVSSCGFWFVICVRTRQTVSFK